MEIITGYKYFNLFLDIAEIITDKIKVAIMIKKTIPIVSVGPENKGKI